MSDNIKLKIETKEFENEPPSITSSWIAISVINSMVIAFFGWVRAWVMKVGWAINLNPLLWWGCRARLFKLLMITGRNNKNAIAMCDHCNFDHGHC